VDFKAPSGQSDGKEPSGQNIGKAALEKVSSGGKPRKPVLPRKRPRRKMSVLSRPPAVPPRKRPRGKKAARGKRLSGLRLRGKRPPAFETPPSKTSRTEENRKTLTAGWVHPGCATGGMCGLVLSNPLPLKTARAWLAAFKRANTDTIEKMVALARSRVAALGEDTYGENGRHMLETPWQDWLWTAGEAQITQPGTAAAGYWQEPAHNDGGASILHLSLTYFGRRDTRFSLASAGPDAFVHSHPGFVYFGAFTGARHQVIHCHAPPDEMLHAGPYELAVSVQVRTALFPHFRARNRETTPNPVPVFLGLAWAFTAALETLPWEMPALRLVQEELAQLAASE